MNTENYSIIRHRSVKRKFSKKDCLFLLLITILSIGCIIWYRFAYSGQGSQVEISVDGKSYGIYELNVNSEIPVMADEAVSNVIAIEHGTAYMRSANCPDQLCVHHKKIKAARETIVCLPNKVVVTITGGEETEFDSIAK